MHLKALRSLVKEDLWSCTRLYDDILFEYPLDSFALTMSYLTGLYTGILTFYLTFLIIFIKVAQIKYVSRNQLYSKFWLDM